MYRFPKTEKALRTRITSYKAAMRKEKRTYGAISDGAGKRYLLTWLYFVLGDLKAGKTYLRWYEKEFEDDVGEPIHEICGALILHRLGDEQRAKYMLASLMLSNLYMIPHLLGEAPPEDTGWRSSNRAGRDYVGTIPAEILSAITDDDRAWLKRLHDSLEFRRYRKRHIEIYRELEHTKGVEKRSPLVRAAGALLDELKQSCS